MWLGRSDCWLVWMLVKCLWIKCSVIVVGTITGSVRAYMRASACVRAIYLYYIKRPPPPEC